jgi:hypothetical protein
MAERELVHRDRRDGGESGKRNHHGNQTRPEAYLLKAGIDGRAEARSSADPLIPADAHNTGRYR